MTCRESSRGSFECSSLADRLVVEVDLWVADLGSGDWSAWVGAEYDAPNAHSAAGRRLASNISWGLPSMAVNLSHSGRHLVMAACKDRHVMGLGVDVEVRRNHPRPGPLARRILAEGEHTTDLIGAWTLKEAVLKATGLGLQDDPRRWRFDGLDTLEARLATAPSTWGPVKGWAVARLELLGPQPAALALAVRTTASARLSLSLWAAPGPDEHGLQARRRLGATLWSDYCKELSGMVSEKPRRGGLSKGGAIDR